MGNAVLSSVQWAQAAIVVGVFAAIAVILAVCILVVTKLCKTDTDEKIENILSHLAGANCGGCGCTGCAGFAEKLANGEASLADCHVTENEQKAQIADILGVAFRKAKPTVSVCRCSGGLHAKNKFTYAGAIDCAEESKLGGGRKACPYGCLGEGNCVRVCPESAIRLKEERADVNPDRCISCGACIHACPKKLFMRIPADARVFVACSSHERGKAVMDVCKYGCIACGKCARTCPSGAIVMTDNLPVIDYEKCIRCGKCAEACPRSTIQLRY